MAVRGEFSAAYLVVLGLETTLALAFGVVIFGERATAGRLIGVFLLVAGMILIERGGASESAEPQADRPAIEASLS